MNHKSTGVWHESGKYKHPIYKERVEVSINSSFIAEPEDILLITNTMGELKTTTRVLALALMSLFFPVRFLGFKKPIDDCVSATQKILLGYGIRTNAWTPIELFNELTRKEHECRVTWASSNNS